ncbi:PhoD-like phosphatase-domain-containing protein [Multifurca ochricompacta]|uniref:PhoD-like phosphatase-domain-containing protein n=1 Tax=Multifurca ochricompacta TaxID=376703 RepID=A0AAD4MAE0_9AGAM|nr:PhoD-like phosphatase-domain-containing protein [Multifurca ochricompacta]
MNDCAHILLVLISDFQDDHEVVDNSWKAGTADSNNTAAGCSFSPSQACLTDRELAVVRAYHEWMPIRQVDVDDKLRIWRNFQIGKLLDLTILDTREFDFQSELLPFNAIQEIMITTIQMRVDASPLKINSLTVMQDSVEGVSSSTKLIPTAGFFNTLSESKQRGAVRRVIGSKRMVLSIWDAWDGYRASRTRILDHIERNKTDNTIILSSDSHANCPLSPTSPGITPETANAISRVLVANNIDLQWSEESFRGFFLLNINPSTLTTMNNEYVANTSSTAPLIKSHT